MKRSAIMGLAIFGTIAILTAPAVALKQPVSSYHYDNQRTGWNPNETTLTPANVGPTSFGVIAKVVLDDQVDAQPFSFQTNRLPPVSRREPIKSFMSPPKAIRSTRSERPMAPCCLAETSELRFPRRLVAPVLLVRMSESTVLQSSMWRRTHYMPSPIHCKAVYQPIRFLPSI